MGCQARYYVTKMTNDGAQYFESNSAWFAIATDSQLESEGVISVDRWSDVLEDWVEARRIP